MCNTLTYKSGSGATINECLVFDKKSSFQEAIKRKLSLTNLNQLQKVLKKTNKQTNKQTKHSARKKKWLGTFAIYHSLPNGILPIKVSFDVQNTKEQKIAAHWPGGVVLPLTSQACSREQSLLDRTWWKEKNKTIHLSLKKCISRCIRHQTKVECFPELETSCMFFSAALRNVCTFGNLLSECNNLGKQQTFRDTTTGIPEKCNLSAEIPYWWRVTPRMWVVLLISRTFALFNQKHYTQIQGSDVSSAWTFCARSSDVISRET